MSLNGTSSPEEIIELFRISTAEAVFLGIESFIQLTQLIILGYIVYNRNYLPIHLVQVPLVASGVVVLVIWWLGALATLRVLPQANDPVFLLCSFWGIWMQQVFGFSAFMSTLLRRFLRLLAVTRFHWNLAGWRIWGAFCVIWSPMWIYGIVASALHANGPLTDGNGFQVCKLNSVALYVMFAITFLYVIGMVVGIIILRKVNHRFVDEYRSNVWVSVYAIIGSVVYVIILLFRFHDQVWGRIFNSMVVTLSTVVYIGFTVGYSAYKCLTDREAYEAAFKNRLKGYSTKSSEGSGLHRPSVDQGETAESHQLEERI